MLLTALMLAAAINHNPKVIQVLLNAGADGKAKTERGMTAFDYAKSNPHLRNTNACWLLNVW